MQNSNECKRNFVAVYDGSSSVEDLKAKFCSTVANDVMLRTGLGVVRMWADEGSRSSRFQMLFTSFQERKALGAGRPCARLGARCAVRGWVRGWVRRAPRGRESDRVRRAGRGVSLPFALLQRQELQVTFWLLVLA